MFGDLDEHLRSLFISQWCGPQEYIALLCSGKLWENVFFAECCFVRSDTSARASLQRRTVRAGLARCLESMQRCFLQEFMASSSVDGCVRFSSSGLLLSHAFDFSAKFGINACNMRAG